MEKALQNRIGYLFAGILIITLLGFYPTYYIHFPAFKGFTTAHHFHGVVALLWIGMLVSQAFLIRAKKYKWHRFVGKSSYISMPLLLISFFFIGRAGYYRSIQTKNEADALAGLTNGIPDILYMGILYSLGIIYKRNTPYHLRFFSSTGLMIMGPGLGRFAFTTFPPQVAIPIMIVSTLGIPVVWLILDIRQKKSPFPMLTFIIIALTSTVVKENGHADWWQSFAKWVVTNLF
ncbi:hypothetical protein GCM10028807_31240 [Spirosoma daeguense]